MEKYPAEELFMTYMPPIHPGEILNEEFLKPLGVSPTRLALDTGMSLSRVQNILAGKCGISADTAVRLATYFGNSEAFWLNCQSTYLLDSVSFSGQRALILSRVHPRERGALIS